MTQQYNINKAKQKLKQHLPFMFILCIRSRSPAENAGLNTYSTLDGIITVQLKLKESNQIYMKDYCLLNVSQNKCNKDYSCKC